MSEKTGLTTRIAAYFRRNPEEWLSFDDMAIKFGSDAPACKRACDYLVERHGLKRETMHLVRILPGEGEA